MKDKQEFVKEGEDVGVGLERERENRYKGTKPSKGLWTERQGVGRVGN